MSSTFDTEGEAKPRPEQHVVKGTGEFFVWKKHDNDKTIDEIYYCFRNWQPPEEVYVYKFGAALLGLTSTMSASYVNYYFRETLFLLNYTRLTSYGVMFLAPGLTAAVLHHFLVTRHILLESPASRCSVCVQVKGMGVQAIAAMGYPLILVPLLCYPVAKRLNNYSIPNLTFNNKASILQFTKDVLRPIRGKLWAITAAQIVLAMGMTFYEQNNFTFSVKPKLDKMKTIFSPLDPRPHATKKPPSTRDAE